MNIRKILLTATAVSVVGAAMLFSSIGASAAENPAVNTATSDDAYTFTITDATKIQKHVAEIITLSDEETELYDVMPDGVTDINDATRIQKIIAKITDLYDPVINKTAITLEPGKTETLSAAVYKDSNPEGCWSINNTSVAEIDENGTVTAVSEGTAVVVYTLPNGASASCKVTVGIPKPTLNKTKITLEAGRSETLSVTVSVDPSLSGEWSSSNSSVATVDENGTVTAKNEGTAVITYSLSNGESASCKVTVSKTKPTLSKTKTTLKVGKYETLSVTLKGISKLDGKWTSSNSYVAEVNKNGKIFAKYKGTTTVTYTLTNGESASCKVTVSGTSAKCIDISVYQPANIDFAAVKAAGYDYVILRAGYGKETYQEDAHFASYYTAAKKAGLKVGVYWYSYATSVSGAETEAKTCLAVLNGRELDLPVYYDIEESGTIYSGAAQSIAETFCAKIEKSGYSAGVYASASVFLNNYLNRDTLAKKGYSIWDAHWGVDAPTVECDIWQYSGTGTISAISGYVDLDYIYNLNILS